MKNEFNYLNDEIMNLLSNIDIDKFKLTKFGSNRLYEGQSAATYVG